MKYEKRKEKELFNIRAKSQAIWEEAPWSLFPTLATVSGGSLLPPAVKEFSIKSFKVRI